MAALPNPGEDHMARTAMPGKPPNEMQISCRRSCRRPHKLTFRSVLTGRCARAERGTLPACRLHLLVRPHRHSEARRAFPGAPPRRP